MNKHAKEIKHNRQFVHTTEDKHGFVAKEESNEVEAHLLKNMDGMGSKIMGAYTSGGYGSKCFGMKTLAGMYLLFFWLMAQIVIASVLLYHHYDPGYNVYLLTHSVLPWCVLLVHFFHNTAAMRWILYCTYTVSVLIGAHLGGIGPFVAGGAWWNYRCVEQYVNADVGVYEVNYDCHTRDWFQLIEVGVRLPF